MALSLSSLPPVPSRSSLGSNSELARRVSLLSVSSFDSTRLTDASSSVRHLRGTRSRRRCGGVACSPSVFVVVAASSDYYSTLGVARSASSKEIKAAYRKLARQTSDLVFYLSSTIRMSTSNLEQLKNSKR